ncbi:hypothetical protein NLU13_0432 [Sarocladium strictum]|uniref:Dipeptidase domain containing protein n=1 Tax=Sarocladium strictum TaxID=5046 RepID=A0AA39GPT9_SARSR|nr:hypothetical protein NLU13_0432 [Sarocladium strictum]
MLRNLVSLSLFTATASASYAFYVGKNLTKDGSVMVGGTGEEVSSHWLQLFPAKDHAANATVSVGVTEDAEIPGEIIEIPQVNHTFRYLSMEYSDFLGFPAPLTNGGLNEKGVAVRDVWASNRDDLVAMTPTPQRGVQYSDLARLVMERASTAREGVELIGRLVEEYSEATYGGNTHLIADKDEGWVVWEMAGGQKLWAAERLGKNDIRVLYPGYIQEFPLNFTDHPDYMGSPNIVSFAVDQGWWDPDGSKPFNIFEVYGYTGDGRSAREGGFKYMSQKQLEDATRAMVPVTEENMMERVRDPRIADDQAGYGQVVSLHEGTPSSLLRIWIAPTGSLAAPFVPWWLGVQKVIPEFGLHRYLYDRASGTFLNTDYQLQEASVFAGRIFKRLLYYMCSAPETLHPVVTQMLEGFEKESAKDIQWVEAAASELLSKGEDDAAHSLLTYYSNSRAEKALALGQTTAAALDGFIKLSGNWKGPEGSDINSPSGKETVNCLIGHNPDKWEPKTRSRSEL